MKIDQYVCEGDATEALQWITESDLQATSPMCQI